MRFEAANWPTCWEALDVPLKSAWIVPCAVLAGTGREFLSREEGTQFAAN
jgi:hypothetical protein